MEAAASAALAQRLLEAGESVVNVPAELAGDSVFDTGHNRKTDARANLRAS